MTTVPQAEKQPVLIAAGGQRASGGKKKSRTNRWILKCLGENNRFLEKQVN